MKILRSYMNGFMPMINAVRAPSKLYGDGKAMARKLVASKTMPRVVRLPMYSTETPWSSTFIMSDQEHKTRKAFSSNSPEHRCP